MSRYSTICSIFLCYTIPIYVQYYIYPVAVVNKETLLYIYQSASDKLELYEYNCEHNNFCKAVSSQYNPADVKLLPDYSGFSFVDNGRIRIKRFAKRAVKTLDIYDPIYGIEYIRWLDAHTCYFHALCDGIYGLYCLTLDEELTVLFKDSQHDCMFPAIFQDQLFYVEKTLTSSPCQTCVMQRNLTTDTSTCIYNFGTRSIIYLMMSSVSRGFVLECTHQDATHIEFSYIQISLQGDRWIRTPLFSFRIGAQWLVRSDTRLYESFIPLIPRLYGDTVYYSSQHEGLLALYMYDMSTGESQCIRTCDHDIFAPLVHNESLLYGESRVASF